MINSRAASSAPVGYCSAREVIAVVQSLRRGRYEHCIDPPTQDRVPTPFTDLALCL